MRLTKSQNDIEVNCSNLHHYIKLEASISHIDLIAETNRKKSISTDYIRQSTATKQLHRLFSRANIATHNCFAFSPPRVIDSFKTFDNDFLCERINTTLTGIKARLISD